MARIIGVDVPAVIVGDMERSLAFYRDLLGMKVVDVKGVDAPWPAAEQDRWHAYHERSVGLPGARIQAVSLQAPNGSYLELIEYRVPDLPADPPSPAEPGAAVISFAVEDSEGVLAKLRAAGIAVLGGPEPYVLDGVESRTSYIRDPDGCVICLFEVVSGVGHDDGGGEG